MKTYWGTCTAALLLAIGASAQAAPEDFAAVVAADTRLDENRALDEARHPALVLDFAALERGAVVADFLAGAGYFSEMIADVVGEDGRVYAMNPPGFHDAKKWSGIMQRYPNLVPLVAPMTHQQLAPASVDVIFTHLTFHDLYWESEQFNYPRLDVPAVLANWHMALKPGGSVVVVDHHGPEGDARDIVARLHRIDRARVIVDMRAAGFELIAQSDVLQRSTDNIETLVFDPSVQGNTSRFMLKFRKN